MTHPDRRTAVLLSLGSALVLAVLALWWVPWQPVPGGVPAPAAPGSLLSADEIEQAEEFSRAVRRWSWASLLLSLAVTGWLGFGAVGRRLVDRTRGPWWWRVLLAVAGVLLAVRLVTLPLSVLHRRELLAYGLSEQAWTGFARDLALAQLVATATTGLALVVLVGCARRWRRAWPAVAGFGLGVLVLLGSFVYPVVVEPLFNEFTPLPAGQLRTEILELADREQVQVEDVLVADASRRTTTLNAYVSGWGSTRRVVVYDTLVDGLARDQTLSVVAHELAHARHRDVVVGTVLGALGAGLAVGLLALVVGWRSGGRGAGRGLSVADPAVVPLVLALLSFGTLLAGPVQNGVSRQIEMRADVDALEATGDPDAFISMQRVLSVRSLADPTPPAWMQIWFGSHPTALTRVAIAELLRPDLERPAPDPTVP
ncbi:M48 family metallopeptidase, partial [Nocardioides sp.]|uniref:M48 family metallopeptidase n=1 Tax=Nocardioides sp. TaxID=35761 RepID=UPI003564F7B9